MIFSEKQVPTLGSSPRASFSGSCSLDLLSCNRMFAGSLRHKDDEGDHQSRKDGCRIKATESEPAVCDRFVEKITKRGTQWTSQNESAPEQQSSGDIGIEIGSEDQNQARGKDECAPLRSRAHSSRPSSRRAPCPRFARKGSRSSRTSQSLVRRPYRPKWIRPANAIFPRTP